MDADGPGGAVAEEAALFLVARGALDVSAGDEFGRAHFDGGVLGEVEDFQKAQLGAEDVVGVLVPALRLGGAFDPVVAGEDWQAGMGA